MSKPKPSSPAIHCAHDRLADIASLIPNPRNPNKHGDKQIALLAKIIRHQGWRAPVVVSKRSGFIVAGHGRLEAAKLLQVQTVPVNDQEFETEADEWAHLVADNRIAELAETDGAMLKDILLELDTGAFDVDVTGWDKAAVDEYIAIRYDRAKKWLEEASCSSAGAQTTLSGMPCSLSSTTAPSQEDYEPGNSALRSTRT